MALAIEALVLPGASRKDQLDESKAEQLAFAQFDDYNRRISGRMLFSPYTPVVEADPAADTFLTAVWKKEGKYQVWMNQRSSGTTLKLAEGDSFDLGKVKVTIAHINPHAVEFDIGGRRQTVTLGKNLADQPPRGFGFGGPGRFRAPPAE